MIQDVDHLNLLPSRWPHSSAQQSGAKEKELTKGGESSGLPSSEARQFRILPAPRDECLAGDEIFCLPQLRIRLNLLHGAASFALSALPVRLRL